MGVQLYREVNSRSRRAVNNRTHNILVSSQARLSLPRIRYLQSGNIGLERAIKVGMRKLSLVQNADVVRMVRRGASVAKMVERINGSESGFQLFPEDLTALREDGVPETVIRAMQARQKGEKLQLVVFGFALTF